MILNRLVQFAESLPDLAPTRYQEKLVTHRIEISTDGSRFACIPLSGATGKRDGLRRPEPHPEGRTSTPRARVFSDDAPYVLGVLADPVRQIEKKHELWRRLTLECADALKLPQTDAVRAWICAGGPKQLAGTSSFAEQDFLSLSVGGVFLTDLPEVRAWWADQAESSDDGVCLVTGRTGAVLRRMPAMIQGISGARSTGSALVSVDFPSGKSYGLDAAYNSPISPDAGEKIGKALDRLLNARTGNRFTYAIKVGKVAILGWGQSPEVKGVLTDFLDKETEGEQEHLNSRQKAAQMRKDAAKVLTQVSAIGVQGELFSSNSDAQGPERAIKLGSTSYPEDIMAQDFNILAVSANGPRIIVRDFHSLTLAKVVENREDWFQRIEIGSNRVHYSLYQMAISLFRKTKDVPAHVINTIAWCALLNRPIPNSILALAVKRNLAMQGPYNNLEGGSKAIAHARMALIKAALTTSENPNEFKMLNPTHPEPAYHCGRLLAVLESIQFYALDSKPVGVLSDDGKKPQRGPNSTIVDRHYGAACATPALVLGTLLKNATSAHLPKLRKEKAKLYGALEGELMQILSLLSNEFPRTQTLYQQGIFSLGFYHQKRHTIELARAKKTLDNSADQNPDSPEESN